MTARIRFGRFFQINQNKPLLGAVCIVISGATGILMASTNTTLVMVALIGLGLLGAMLFQPELATVGFVFGLYTNAVVVATRFHGVPFVAGAAFPLVLLIPLASFLIIRRQKLIFSQTLTFMMIYLLAMLISAIYAQTVTQSASWIANFLAEGLLLYFLLTNVVRTRSSLRFVIWALLAAGSFMGAISIYQTLQRTYSNNYGGFAQVMRGGFAIGEDLSGKINQARVAGPIGETNRYAQVMLVLVPIALFQFFGEKTRGLRILAAGSVVLILSGMLVTYSRGAAVALFVVLAVMMALGYIKVKQAMFLGLALLLIVPFVAPQLIRRLDTLRGVQGVFSEGASTPDGAVVGRLTENLAAFYAWLDHPILGVGPGQYYEQYSQAYANKLGLRFLEVNRRAHNLYLEMAADLGIIGLTAFLLIVGSTMLQLWKARKRLLEVRPDLANIATGSFLSIMAYMLSAVFLQLSFQRYFWFLIALGNIALYIINQETVSDELHKPSFAQRLHLRRTPGETRRLPPLDSDSTLRQEMQQ